MTALANESTLEFAQMLIDGVDCVLAVAVQHGAEVTANGRHVDDHQVLSERVAYLATELRAAHELLAHARALRQQGAPDDLVEAQTLCYAAEVANKARAQAEGHAEPPGLTEELLRETLGNAGVRAAERAGLAEGFLRAIGRRVIESGGGNQWALGDEAATLTRDSVRSFAKTEVVPLAEEIHRNDLLVPDELINKMAGLGLFSTSIPEEYGGSGMGNLVMVVTTEELSAASLGAAGSLITRPEILTKALLRGGTEEQKRHWLPKLASGEIMVGVAVTEPDTGSDVSSLQCRAEPATVGGRAGWQINGAKAWSTFSGRANVLALLARTNFEPDARNRALSLFIVPKDVSYGHAYEVRQPGGGVLTGQAIATPGYRGMHSFMLQFENYFVPAENLVGGDEHLHGGFYLQMAGFNAGRLQTGGRALGVAQAALEHTCAYVTGRSQFGKPLSEYQLTQYRIGQIATRMAAARALTYATAGIMDGDENIALEPAMAKLLASDVAVWATQECQLLHGGWGYAEETPISRLVIDAQVLPIFEGVKAILELRVIARNVFQAAGAA